MKSKADMEKEMVDKIYIIKWAFENIANFDINDKLQALSIFMEAADKLKPLHQKYNKEGFKFWKK